MNTQTKTRKMPRDVMRQERVGMIGSRGADLIKARGQNAPHPEAGHMTASLLNQNVKNHLLKQSRPHMTALFTGSRLLMPSGIQF